MHLVVIMLIDFYFDIAGDVSMHQIRDSPEVVVVIISTCVKLSFTYYSVVEGATWSSRLGLVELVDLVDLFRFLVILFHSL
jgi:hypothetical protein